MTDQISVSPPIAPDARDLRLDLARGVALIFTFIDHVPENALSWVTLRNYGFSDASEVFVFVSGYTCMVAYGRFLRTDGWASIWARSIRRGVEIYAAFLLLIVAYCAIIWLVGQTQRQLDVTNTGVLFHAPGSALAHAMGLRYAPVNTDILPTFVLLHCGFPIVLWAVSKNAATMLIVSASIYLGVQFYDWHIPTWPKGELYFNPFAWQFLFAIGAWCATASTPHMQSIVRSRALLVIAIAYLIASLLLTLTWHIKPLETLVPEAIGKLIYPIDKSHLSPLRIVHFLALVFVVTRFIPFDWRALSSPFITGSIRCGENALPIYCISVLLSFLAGVALDEISGTVPIQVALSIIGIGLLATAAAGITWISTRDRSAPKLF